MVTRRTARSRTEDAIGERLGLLRRAFSLAQGHARPLTQSEFARLCGIGVQAWNNCEKQGKRMGLDNAILLRAATGAPLDFIYFGSRVGLPYEIATALGNLQKRR